MTRPGRARSLAVACTLAAALALGVFSGVARADGGREDDLHPPMPIVFTVQSGGMFPAGDEGSGLQTGAQVVASIGYEYSTSFTAAAEAGFTASTDPFRTHVVWAGLNGRLNPNPDLRALYVQGGAALYDISYHRASLSRLEPPSKVRPGLSFGIGWDAGEFSGLTLGVLGSYHGIVVARGDALSYLTLGLYASLRPSIW